jgi:hypothetical protein
MGSPGLSLEAAAAERFVAGRDDSQLKTINPEMSEATARTAAMEINRRARCFLSGPASHVVIPAIAIVPP